MKEEKFTDMYKKCSKATKIFWDIMIQMFKEAEPSLDLPGFYDELIEKGEKSGVNWFYKYYLPQSRQDEIIEELIKGKKLREKEISGIKFVCYLGFAPNGHKDSEEVVE